MGLGLPVAVVEKPKKKTKGRKPQISGIYDVHIPMDAPKKKNKPHKASGEEKKPKEPKESKDKGQLLEHACEEVISLLF